MDEVVFTITDEALDFIVEKALEYKLGGNAHSTKTARSIFLEY